MRRLLVASLIFFAATAFPRTVESQSITSGSSSLAGTREVGLLLTGRLLSTEYSAEDGRAAVGGTLTFGTHLRPSIAIQGGLGINYSRQEYNYYKPPLWTFTPAISLILQRSTAADVQPYGIVGAGYEFVRYTHPRCDCEQSRSLGVGNVGVGLRKMLGSSRAFRMELSSQIGKGGPTFSGMAGMSLFLGSTRVAGLQPPRSIRNEPPVSRPPQGTTARPAAPPTAPPAAAPTIVPQPAPQTVPPPAPANNVLRAPSGAPLPTGVGTVLLSFDGTQVDFTKTTWREEAETLIDALVVDLTSDAGQGVKISIEAHTDNVGSNAANIMIGLDRARAVREYLVSQGVAADRIRVSSLGEDSPIAPNTTAIGRQQNRRIIIKRDN